MRVQRLLASISATLTLVLLSAQTVLSQDAPVKVEVSTAPSTTVWYADPVWIGIGVVAVLLVIVLIVLASRGKSSTTVIR